MKTLPLTNSQEVALVDDEDFGWVSRVSWHIEVDARGYRKVRSGYGMLLSRFVMGATDAADKDAHHIDRDPLNNQKANLRIISHGTHTVISKLEAGPVRGRKYKGAYFRAKGKAKPWQALIRIDGKLVSLGYFATEEEAGRAYDKAVKQVYGGIPGVRPYVNFPTGEE